MHTSNFTEESRFGEHTGSEYFLNIDNVGYYHYILSYGQDTNPCLAEGKIIVLTNDKKNCLTAIKIIEIVVTSSTEEGYYEDEEVSTSQGTVTFEVLEELKNEVDMTVYFSDLPKVGDIIEESVSCFVQLNKKIIKIGNHEAKRKINFYNQNVKVPKSFSNCDFMVAEIIGKRESTSRKTTYLKLKILEKNNIYVS